MTNINPVWLHLMNQYKALCDAGQSNTCLLYTSDAADE